MSPSDPSSPGGGGFRAPAAGAVPETVPPVRAPVVEENGSRPSASLAPAEARPGALALSADTGELVTPEVSSLSYGALLAGFRRRWALAIGLGVLLGGTAAVLTLLLVPPRLTVQTLLHVSANTPSILGQSAESRIDFHNYQRTQLVMIKSKLVLNAALRQPGVSEVRILRAQPDPIAWLETQVVADFSLAPEILRISMTGEEPRELAVIVNAVREAYVKEVVNKELIERHAHYDRLQQLYAQYEDVLKAHRRSMRELARTVGSRNSETLVHKQKFALERLAATHRQLIDLQGTLRTALIQQESAQEEAEAGRAPLNPAAVEELLDKEPAIARLKALVSDLEDRLEETRRVAVQGSNDRTVIHLQDDLADARKALAERRSKLRPEIEKRLQEQSQMQAIAISAQNRKKIKLMKELERQLAKDVQDQERDAALISKGSLEIETLGEDIAQTEEVAKRIGNQLETLKVELQAPSRVSLLEEAVVSGTRDEHRQAKAAGAAGLAGFGLALFGVCWWDARGRRIGSPQEVTQSLKLRLVGTLPPVSDRARAGRYGQNQLAESVDAMRTTLLHVAGTEQLRSVMVTSALPGEGKTSLSGQLSASLARAGCRTLLVDADLRNPAAHRLFDLPASPGLSELLRGEARVDDVVRATPVEGLWLIPAGTKDRLAIGALSRSGKEIFRQLEDRFDFVVVDTSPVLPVADTLLVGQQVDAVIFSVLRDVSRMPALQAAYERMSLLGFRILGAAVSGVPGETYGSVY